MLFISATVSEASVPSDATPMCPMGLSQDTPSTANDRSTHRPLVRTVRTHTIGGECTILYRTALHNACTFNTDEHYLKQLCVQTMSLHRTGVQDQPATVLHGETHCMDQPATVLHVLQLGKLHNADVSHALTVMPEEASHVLCASLVPVHWACDQVQ